MAKGLRVSAIPQKRLALAVAAALMPFTNGAQADPAANALPTGGQVTAGTAAISQPSANALQIDQASDKAILQWNSFSIGAGAWVNFTQPSASAIALNRVLGNNPSEIFGRLSANGQVFLSNPSGVLFAPGASVDVGALFATTLAITDSDFLAGRYNFYNPGGAGAVVNQGSITANGYAALAGPQVRNDGVIVANSGSVVLAAGERVSLDMVGDGLISVSVDQAAMNASAINAGTIQADGGKVLLTARSANALLDTVVNNSGIIRANSLALRNGEIVLDGGSAGTVANSGVLQGTGASVAMTGGNVTINPGSAINNGISTLTLDGVSDISVNAPIAVASAVFSASAGQNMTVASAVNSGSMSIDVGNALTLNAVAQDARLTSNGGQTITAGQLIAHAENGRRAVVVNNGGDQSIFTGAGGITLDVLNGQGVAQIANNVGSITNGTQSVQTSGALSALGGSGGGSSNSGVFQNQTGTQTVSADSITLQGATTGNNGGAFIRNTNGGGDQTIQVASALNITGGASGLGNRAGIQTNGNQTITGNADIQLTGGSSGAGLNSDNTSNAAQISANAVGKTQTISARNITLNAGSGGTDTFAAITSNTQRITATGDVHITGGSNGGDSNGARIGAPGSTTVGSDIQLNAHDIVLTGGATDSGAAIGASANSGSVPNTIKITASGDVVLNSGAGNGSRIGAPNGSSGGGDIEIDAVNIALNGGPHQTVIRTTGTVKLNASGSISEGSNGAVLANTLNAVAAGMANLGGSNQVATFNATSGSGVLLNNTGTLQVTGLSTLGDATLTNAGTVAVTGPWSSRGAFITTTGTGSDLDVTNLVSANGPMTINVAGGISVLVDGPDVVGGLSAYGDQSINASSLSVTSQGGAFASINELGGGTQSITITGGSIDMRNLGSNGEASITGGTAQTITLIDGDHFAVTASGGGRSSVLSFGSQTVSLTGSGRNALIVGSAGALGASSMMGSFQSITAGAPGEQGSITVVGSPALGTGIVTSIGDGSKQTISTSGALSLTGDVGFANIAGWGGQTISAESLHLSAQNFGNATISNSNGDQHIAVGAGGITLDGGSGFASIGNSPAVATTGKQSIETTGTLTLLGAASGSRSIVQNQRDTQAVSAANIELRGADSGSNGGAFISSSGGQVIDVADGTISVVGGSGGLSNRAGINAVGNQTITGNANISVTGGAGGSGSQTSGTQNSANIGANGQQTITARSITVNAGGGTDAFATITGGNQLISAIEDVRINGSAGGGSVNGARIGSGTGPTNLTLGARDVVLTGGSANGVGLGSSVLSSAPNTITVTASRDVSLNAGSIPGAGARIGSSARVALANGDISITAGRDIAFNGSAQAAATIRTTGSVTLQAGGEIAESPNSSVLASSLASSSGGSTLLGGSNQVATFNGFSGGDLLLNNLQALQLTGVSAGEISISNAGAVTISGPVMAVTGPLSMDVLGNLDVRSIVSSNGGQRINAQGLAVTADGGVAQLGNFGGNQTITVSGGSIDVQTLAGGGSASIVNSGGGLQSIVLLGGDHIAVNGMSGFASITSDAAQVLSATGSGANAIRVGSMGARGPTMVFAQGTQNVTAGAAGESGAITIVGAAGQNALTGFLTNPTPGGTQTISTAGEISIEGGSAATQNFNTPAGIFHNGSGQQTISAAGISLTGGNAGNTNAALINALGGGVPANAGNQVLNVGAGGIRITAGSVGSGNRAGIFGSANQTINVEGDIVVTGGGGGSGFASDNSSNNAFISDNGPSGLQTINARNITINAGADGSDTFAAIVGPHQVIAATDDVVLNGGGGFGTSNGARIGGRGGQSTDLWLAARNVVLNGGMTTGASLGSSGAGTAQPNTIAIQATGDVALNEGSGAGSRIGSAGNGLASGDISVSAGGGIELNGAAQPTAIRTTGNVALQANGAISEGSDGFIIANALTTASGGSTVLAGPNSVSNFVASAAGDVSVNNTSAVLSLGSMTLPASLIVQQAGDLLIGDAGALTPTMVFASGAMSLTSGGSMMVRGSDSAANASSVVLTSGPLGIHAGSLSVLGGASPYASAVVSGRSVNVATLGNLTLTGGTGDYSRALLLSGSNISLTVGGLLTVNRGNGEDSYARIQAAQNGVISLYFPNRSSGGYTVDGFATPSHGADGLFTGSKPVKLGDTLLLKYGF